jgi:hypothetical protein
MAHKAPKGVFGPHIRRKAIRALDLKRVPDLQNKRIRTRNIFYNKSVKIEYTIGQGHKASPFEVSDLNENQPHYTGLVLLPLSLRESLMTRISFAAIPILKTGFVVTRLEGALLLIM